MLIVPIMVWGLAPANDIVGWQKIFLTTAAVLLLTNALFCKLLFYKIIRIFFRKQFDSNFGNLIAKIWKEVTFIWITSSHDLIFWFNIVSWSYILIFRLTFIHMQVLCARQNQQHGQRMNSITLWHRFLQPFAVKLKRKLQKSIRLNEWNIFVR